MKFRDVYYFLSNMYPAKVPMNIGGTDYIFDNAEAAFQAQKNADWAAKFVGLNGFDAKRLGRQVPIDRAIWNSQRIDAMRNAVQSKFNNNTELMQQLQGLADEYISEDNDWGDTFWGISQGRGQNNLGKILMDVRDTALQSAPVVGAVTDVTPTPVDDAITDGLNALAIGSTLTHPKFGQGTITNVADDIVDVDFNGTTKHLGLDWIANNILPKSDVPAELTNIANQTLGGETSEDLPYMLEKIISGGQTGADVLGLQIAKEHGIPTGGYITNNAYGKPLIEYNDGIDRTQFGMNILPYPGNIRDAYVNRTTLNAANADGTVYFRGPEQGNGWFATRRAANAAGKPFLDNPQSAQEMLDWLKSNNVKTLNVAGNRGSKFSDATRQNMSNILNEVLYQSPQTVEGELLSAPQNLIMQQVNNRGVIGSSDILGQEIKDDLSQESFAKYQKYAVGNPEMMGKTLPLPSLNHPGRTYLNVFGQDNVGYGAYTDMSALEKAFTNIANRYSKGTPIAMPVGMGAGLAGGNWDEIEALADRILGSKLSLFKYKL